MTYWNPIERYGVDRFAADLAAAGGAGLITPDLPPDDAAEWLAASDETGLDRVFLVSPSSTDARIDTVPRPAAGSSTRPRSWASPAPRADRGLAPDLVRRSKAVTELPVGVGLGVSNGAQAAAVAASPTRSSSARPSSGGRWTRARPTVTELTRELADGVRRERRTAAGR